MKAYDTSSSIMINELQQENKSLLNTVNVLKRQIEIYRQEAKDERIKRENYEKLYYEMFVELGKLRRSLCQNV